MAKLYDGKQKVEIRMMVWNGTGYDPDWSDDFFEVGALASVEIGPDVLHCVPDVTYCIEQAQEWAEENESNEVFVREM